MCRRLLADEPRMVYSVSCTTRPPRGNEQDGRDYHFLSPAEFRRRLRRGCFLEHAMVHGHHYGTLRAPVLRALRQGRDVLMDIDVQGAAQVRRAVRHGRNALLRAALVDIFIAPPSMRELRRRLECRHEDAPEEIRRRLRNARIEMSRRREFRHVIVNDDLETAYRELRAILDAARGQPG